MPRLQTSTTNFTAGEFSPLLEGRSDLEKYNSSAKELKNVEVLKQGGFTIRPAMEFLGAAISDAAESRIIDFIYSRTDSYALEFSGTSMRVWRNGALVETTPGSGIPYVLTTPFTQTEVEAMDYTQGGDSMILTVSTRLPQRLRRFADNVWDIGAVPFSPAAVGEIGERPPADITLSLATVGAGRTATASAPAFLNSDVGRSFSAGVGIATITGFTSTTQVTITITTAFSSTTLNDPDWVIGESPMTQLTPSGTGPVGATITLTLGAAGWRSTNVGGLVEINGGLVKIVTFTSTVAVDGVVLRELASAVAAPADSWALLLTLWRDGDGYPRTATFFQQRLWFGSTARFPQSFWGSRSGLYFDFTPGTDDDSAVYKTANSDQTNPLQFLCASKSLVILGYGAEFEGKGGIEKPITQTNMQINVESEWGSETVRPVTVGKEILFVERSGALLRSVFPGQVDGLDASDLSVFSEHLTRAGIKWISFEKNPASVVWVCTNEGVLHEVTFNREQNTLAWTRGETAGVVEWGATIPEGARDVTYVSVVRTVGGVAKRFIERMNRSVVRGRFDSMLETTGPATTVWPCGHLIGETVNVIGDGVFLGAKVVDGSGNITIDTPATTVARGLPFEAKAVLRSPEAGTGTGTSQGQSQSTHSLQILLHESVGTLCNGDQVEMRSLDEDGTADAEVPAFSGYAKLSVPTGWDEGESDIELVQNQGMPWTVLAAVRGFTVNA